MLVFLTADSGGFYDVYTGAFTNTLAEIFVLAFLVFEKLCLTLCFCHSTSNNLILLERFLKIDVDSEVVVFLLLSPQTIFSSSSALSIS